MKIKITAAALFLCVSILVMSAPLAQAATYSPYEALSSSIATLITSITDFIQSKNFATVAASVSAPVSSASANATFKVSHVNDTVSDQKLFKTADAQVGFTATAGGWRLVLDPLKTQSLQLFNIATDPNMHTDVYARRPGIANSLRARFINWRVQNTEVPLLNGQSFGSVSVKDDVYTFASPAGQTPGRFVFASSSAQKIGKGDLSFAAHIKSVGRDNTVRVIASQPKSWVLQINAKNRLEVVVYDASTTLPTIIVDDSNNPETLIAQNTEYDVMFSIVGMSKVKNFVRLAVRKTGDNATFLFAGDGIGVTSVAANTNPVNLSSSASTSLFSGVIQSPRLFTSFFSRGQMESLYTEQDDSCTSDGVTVTGGRTAVFYDTSVTYGADTCEAHAEERMCLGDRLRGNSAYVYSSCTYSATTSVITTLARTPGIPTVTTFPDGTILNVQKTIAGRPSKAGLDDHLYEVGVYSSTNTAKTWKRISTVFSTTTASGHSLSVNNTLITKLKNGDLMVVYRQHKLSSSTPDTPPEDTVDGQVVDEYILKSAISKNNGNSWQDFAVIDSRVNAGLYGTWEPFVIESRMRPGVIQVYFAHERHRADTCPRVDDSMGAAQDILVRESKDGGKTWGSTTRTALSRGVSREGVPAVVELNDGSLLAVFESWRGSDCGKANADLTIGQAQSKDGGLTWNYLPFVFEKMQLNARQSWPYMTKLADGRVLLKFASTEQYEDVATTTRTESRDIELLTSQNVPGYANPPRWNTNAFVALTDKKLGNVAQLSNGDIIVAGSTGADAKINIIPLELFGSILK